MPGVRFVSASTSRRHTTPRNRLFYRPENPYRNPYHRTLHPPHHLDTHQTHHQPEQLTQPHPRNPPTTPTTPSTRTHHTTSMDPHRTNPSTHKSNRLCEVGLPDPHPAMIRPITIGTIGRRKAFISTARSQSLPAGTWVYNQASELHE